MTSTHIHARTSSPALWCLLILQITCLTVANPIPAADEVADEETSHHSLELSDIPAGHLYADLVNLSATFRKEALEALDAAGSGAYSDTEYVHTDKFGNLLVVDPIMAPPSNDSEIAARHARRDRERRDSLNPTPDSVDAFGLPIHHSLPGAANVMWLNMQGKP